MMKDTMTYKGFIGSVQLSAEDRCLHGKIEAIDDLVSFEGNTVASLEKTFHEAVNDYIELCKEVGKEPQKSFRGSFNVRVGAEVHRQAARMAIMQGKNLNTFVEEAIRAMLGMEQGRRLAMPVAMAKTTYRVTPKEASGRTIYRGTPKTGRDATTGKMVFRAKSKTVHVRAHKATMAKSGKKCKLTGGRK